MHTALRSSRSTAGALGLALALALFGFMFSASQAHAGNFQSSIQVTSSAPVGCQLSSNSVVVSGTATAGTPPGQIGQYHVIIDWGDGNTTDNAEVSAFGTEDPSTRNFTGTHNYTVPGTYHVVATVYHQNVNGQDNVSSGANDFVVCIVSPLVISKTANTTLTRTSTWSIAKTEDAPDPVLLTSGVSFPVNYQVTAGASSIDSAWAVSGNISITNPSGNPAVSSVAVTDAMDGAGSPTGAVVCPGTTIAAGATMVCTYSATLPDGATRTNIATVTTNESLLGGQATASVNFGSATVTKVNDCATVTDTNAAGPQAQQLCAGVDTLPKTWNYSVTFGKDAGAQVALACGVSSYTNTATLTPNTSGIAQTASATVNFNVDCPLGCTLTQGYWKTHNTLFKGGASKHADSTWLDSDIGGPGANLLNSGLTWFNVFWTAPSGGNAWYQLAHQYMAASLNKEKGTTVPVAVQTALTHAQALLSGSTPAQIGALKGNNATRQDFITTAGILGNYNEGKAGVPHCSDPDVSTVKTFSASNSSYYNGPTDASPLYATGAFNVQWDTATNQVIGGYYNEVIGPTTYFNNITSGTVSGSTFTLNFTRTIPNAYAFSGTVTLSGSTMTGTLDGPYYFTATGTVTP